MVIVVWFFCFWRKVRSAWKSDRKGEQMDNGTDIYERKTDFAAGIVYVAAYDSFYAGGVSLQYY